MPPTPATPISATPATPTTTPTSSPQPSIDSIDSIDSIEPPSPKKTSAPAPTLASQPSPLAPSSTAPVSHGRYRRVDSVSIKATPVSLDALQPQTPAAPPLDEQHLHECWNAMLEAMKGDFPKLSDILKDKQLRLDEEDHFTIIVSNNYTESEIRPHLIRMLTFLRTKSGRPALNCQVQVVYEKSEAKPYAPRDKYDVMQHSNPALETFRILFPEVDY